MTVTHLTALTQPVVEAARMSIIDPMSSTDMDVLASPAKRTMKIVVTGGSGRIGQAVCGALVQRGHEVTNLDVKLPRRKEVAGRFVYCDLRDRAVLQPILERHEAICHLGEIPGLFGRSPEDVYAANTAIGSTVMQTAADVGMQSVIYTSSCQAYGYWEGMGLAPLHLPFDETMPLRPRNAYAASKVANENFAQALVAQRPELSLAVFRFPWVMSDEVNDENVGWFINAPRRHVDGFGTYVHVDDAARAYVAVVENPRPGVEAYHFVADQVKYSEPVRDVLMRVQPDWPTLPIDWPASKSPVLTDKARRHFGWRPAFDLLETARRLGKMPEAPPPMIARKLSSVL